MDKIHQLYILGGSSIFSFYFKYLIHLTKGFKSTSAEALPPQQKHNLQKSKTLLTQIRALKSI